MAHAVGIPLQPAAQNDPSQDFKVFTYLDGKGPPLKVHPTNHDRDWKSPNVHTSATVTNPSGIFTYKDSSHAIQIDGTALNRFNLGDVEISLILIRRVDGVPHYRYLGHNPRQDSSWSMSKFMAATGAAIHLRKQSNKKVGLDGSVITVNGSIPLGDLITAFCYYDETHFHSNGIATWFNNVAHRSRVNALVKTIGAAVGFPGDDFGGGFGDLAPLPLKFKGSDGTEVTMPPNTDPGFSNRMHTMTSAEFLKRLVMHRENPNQAFNLEWADVQTILYGAENSKWYPDTRRLHGMSADTATYIQNAFVVGPHDDQFFNVAQRAHGQWRICSKLGFDGKSVFVHTGYACFPVFDSVTGQIKDDWGKEFIISGRVNSLNGDNLLAEAYRKVILAIEDSTLA